MYKKMISSHLKRSLYEQLTTNYFPHIAKGAIAAAKNNLYHNSSPVCILFAQSSDCFYIQTRQTPAAGGQKMDPAIPFQPLADPDYAQLLNLMRNLDRKGRACGGEI